MVRKGEVYRHCKGKDKLYRVLEVAKDCENLNQEIVVYEQLYDSEFPKGTCWIRKIEDFEGYKIVEGKSVKRFERVEG